MAKPYGCNAPLTDSFLLLYSWKSGGLILVVKYLIERGIHAIIYTLLNSKPQRGGGVNLCSYTSFWKAVMVEITAYYFCKGLDVAFKYFFSN